MKFNFILLLQIFVLPLIGQVFPKTISALNDGDIYKIAIKKDGIYKLTKKNLDDLGINTNSINPKQIKLFSNYGGSLPEGILMSYPDDLIEIPITISGEEDAKFNDADFILFYGEGADKWKYDESTKDFTFDKNIYSDKNFVYIKISNGDGLRIKPKSILDAQPTLVTKTYNSYEIYHEDKYNLLGQNIATHGSGKLWVGEYLANNQEKDLSSFFNFKNVDFSSPIQYQLIAAGRSEKENNLLFNFDSKQSSIKFSGVSFSGGEDIYARLGSLKSEHKINNSSPKITLKYTGNDAWLDYLQFTSQRFINSDNGNVVIRNKEFGNHKYSKLEIIGEASGLWDVTDLSNISSYKISNGTVSVETGSPKQQLVLFKESLSSTPELVGKIKNQNLHGLNNEDLIILYHENFKTAAEKLALHRSNVSKYKVKAINVADVYEEFGCGKLDPSAIRNFAKMLYDRSPSFRYLLLLGDGSYDYKGLVKNVPAQNFIPVYETDESLDPINAFPTDDYYALLSNNEGASLKGAIDINVGRITVSTAEEADAVINKIIHYEIGEKRFGDWRLNSGFAGDDEDGNRHTNDADIVAEESFKRDPLLNQQKVYFDAFVQENTAGGERYPDATEAINRNIEKGQLTWSYLGHGGPKGLAQERVVKLSDIESWSNMDSPTLFITATCSFSGYDDPSINTGGELALKNSKGGAIGLLTTVRSVYANENFRLTSNVYKNLYRKENGLGLTLGEIIRSAKNATYADTTGDNTRKFTLLGDPSQRLALPQHEIVLNKINGKDASTFVDTLGALQKVVLQGQVNDFNGALVKDFSGNLNLTMFDKISTFKTLGNDVGSPINSFKVYKNVIFKGQAQVINGLFTIEFVIPKDINYEIGKSRLSFYANSNDQDAAGYYNSLVVGGSSLTSVKDDTPPKMLLHMNDLNFVYGGITNEKPELLVTLEDDFGINTTGNSIGHDITAKLIGNNIEEDFVLNDFYKASANNFRKGEVRFPLSNLKPGLYTIKVKAWDISNNSVEGIIEFRVIDAKNQKLMRVINYPNPFVNNTEFSFEHDLANTNVDIQVNIYTLTGKLVKSIVDSKYSSGYRINNIMWEGKDDFGSNLSRGVYVYKITMYAPDLKLKRESGFEKLVKI
jgi:hypothetical protein